VQGPTAPVSITPSVPCTDLAGNTTNPQSATVAVDEQPPTSTTITGAPVGRVDSSSASLSLSGSDALSGVGSFTCTLDGAGYPCDTTTQLSGLADGSHTFTAQAVDLAGNVDPTGASATWTVDTTSPTVTFDAPASGATTAGSGQITFHATDPDDNTFTDQCSLDGAPVAPCSSPYSFSGLANGDHALSVVATDPAGNPSAVATLDFTVDTTTPTISIDS